MVIQFNNVGRNHYSGTLIIADGSNAQEIEATAYEHIRHQLLSREMETYYDANVNSGEVIVGGMRIVGTFKVVK